MSLNLGKRIFEEAQLFFKPVRQLKLETEVDETQLLLFLYKLGWQSEIIFETFKIELLEEITSLAETVQEIEIFLNKTDISFDDFSEGLKIVKKIIGQIDTVSKLVNVKAMDKLHDPLRKLPISVLNLLIVEYLENKGKYIVPILELLYIVKNDEQNFIFDDNDVDKVIYVDNRVSKIDFAAIPRLISTPLQTISKHYFLIKNDGKFSYCEDIKSVNYFSSKLLYALTRSGLIQALGLYNVKAPEINSDFLNSFGLGLTPENVARIKEEAKGLIILNKRYAFVDSDYKIQEAVFGATLGFVPKDNGGPGIFMLPYFTLNDEDKSTVSFDLPKTIGAWQSNISFSFDLGGVKITKSGVAFYSLNGQSIKAAIRANRNALSHGNIVLGRESETRVVLKDISFGTEFQFRSDKVDLALYFSITKASLVLKFGKSDSFLKTLTNKDVVFDFDVEAGWSMNNGFHFKGSGGLEINLSKNIQLGPVELQDSKIRISAKTGDKPGDEPGIDNSFGTTLKTNLGPLKAVIEDLGLKFNLGFPPDMKGNLGLIDLDLGIKPPKGVGLSIDAHGFRGGGYLFIDVEKGEYAGALELEVFKMFTLKALGIITTKLPDGSPGFSLLILITAEFQAVQLGFGFTLNGVGGLLGLNRTSNMEEIGRRVKTGTSGEIFFPKNLVANIKTVISGMKAVFPEHQGNFVFGPVGKIGWGTPTIVEVELGLVIDVPDPVRIAIIGGARMDLPHRDVWPRVIQLRMAFAVSVDFGKKMFALNATLFDSRIVLFTISGDMVLRIGWGANPMFIFSIGGFHPKYREAPADLQNMNRLSIRALDLPFIKMGYDLYLAITSNTVQFGINAYLSGKVLNVEASGSFEFDVLFQFNPFYFVASVSCKAALIIDLGFFGRHELFAIHIYGELSGPKPWHIVGRASFKILWFELSFNLEHEWGDKAEIIPLVKVNVLETLLEEFSKPLNWQGIPDPGSVQGVTIGQIDPGEIVLFPSTTLRVSQKVAPLGLKLEKIGEAAIEGATKFEITSIEIGGSPALTESFVKEQFAPANFLKLSDDEKIARPSFEMMPGGMSFKTLENGNKTEGNEVPVTIEYEVNYLKAKERQAVKVKDGRQMKELKTLPLTPAQFNRESRGSAAFRTPFSGETTRPSHHAPQPIRKREVGYQVVDAADNNKVLHEDKFGSQAEAFQFLVAEAQKDSTRQLEVVTQYN